MSVTHTFKDQAAVANWKLNDNFDDLRRVSAFYYTVSGVTVATGASFHRVNFSQKVWDTDDAVTVGATDWKFSAPVSGYYQASSYIQFNNDSWGANSYARLFFNFSDDSTARIVGRINAYSTDALYHAFNGTATGYMNKSDEFYVTIENSSGGDRNLITTKYEVWVTVDRV